MLGELNTVLAGSPFSAQHFVSNWVVQIAPEFKYSGLLFALLRHRGLHIWEGRPCFVSTTHTAEQRAHIVDAFRESVAELEEAGFFERSASAPKAITIPGAISLTQPQQEVLLVCQQSDTANTSFNETWTLLFDGPLDLPALRASVQTIVNRHDALRATFDANSETVSVAPALLFELPLTDLSSLDESDRSARLAAIAVAESTRVFDLAHGPMLAPQVVRLAPERHAFIFNAHHLACDGWSCDIFLRELAQLYSAARAGRDATLPAALQMRAYQEWEAEIEQSPELVTETNFWLEKYRTIPSPLELPGDRSHPAQRTYRGASETEIIPAESLARDLEARRAGRRHAFHRSLRHVSDAYFPSYWSKRFRRRGAFRRPE